MCNCQIVVIIMIYSDQYSYAMLIMEPQIFMSTL